MVPKNDLVELKSLANPPQAVLDTVNAACILLGKPLHRHNDWKRHLANTNIMNEFNGFDAKNCSVEDAQRAKDKITGYTKEQIKSMSCAAVSLFVWTESMVNAVLST